MRPAAPLALQRRSPHLGPDEAQHLHAVRKRLCATWCRADVGVCEAQLRRQVPPPPSPPCGERSTHLVLHGLIAGLGLEEEAVELGHDVFLHAFVCVLQLQVGGVLRGREGRGERTTRGVRSRGTAVGAQADNDGLTATGAPSTARASQSAAPCRRGSGAPPARPRQR